MDTSAGVEISNQPESVNSHNAYIKGFFKRQMIEAAKTNNKTSKRILKFLLEQHVESVRSRVCILMLCLEISIDEQGYLLLYLYK